MLPADIDLAGNLKIRNEYGTINCYVRFLFKCELERKGREPCCLPRGAAPACCGVRFFRHIKRFTPILYHYIAKPSEMMDFYKIDSLKKFLKSLETSGNDHF